MIKSKIDKKRRREDTYVQTQTDKDPAYLKDVIEKVKKHRKFKDLNDDEAKVMAKRLTDHHELHAEFSHLLDMVFEKEASEVQEEAEATDYGEDLETKREKDAARDRAVQRLKNASQMPVQLHLRELNRKNLPPRFVDQFAKLFAVIYGPLHAALIVGDVTLEWDDSSLVVPERGVVEPDIQMDIAGSTSAMQAIAKQQSAMKRAVKSLDYNTQVEQIYTATVDRSKMIHSLIEVIVKYNRYHKYSMAKKNCQTFVIDAMKAMGVKVPPQPTGRLKEYLKELRLGVKNIPEEFQTHKELDRYVRESQKTGEFDELTQHDKEYLLCLYFQFHLETLEEDKGEPCQISNCMKDEVARAAIESPVILEEYCK